VTRGERHLATQVADDVAVRMGTRAKAEIDRLRDRLLGGA
jgi:hypothetical protein